MAAVPTGPSSSPAASPAPSTPLPGDRGLGPGDRGLGPGAGGLSAGEEKRKQGSGVTRSVLKQQDAMLAHPASSPAARRLQDPGQMNGSVPPPADHHGLMETRPDDPRPSVDHRDGCCDDQGPPNTTAVCHREGPHGGPHGGPFSPPGGPPLWSTASMNGTPTVTRGDAFPMHHPTSIGLSDHPRKEGDHDPSWGPPGREGDALDGTAPPVAELARLHLGGGGGDDHHGVHYVRYESESQMPWIMRLITKDLSEPYSIYTYRYFIHNWPQLCFLALVEQECVGAIVCKLDMHKKMFRRGYIAMLAVDSKHRRKSIGTNLVKKAIYAMVEGDCDEVVLETEITNKSALKLYENLGFVRDKRLFRYYLNGVDALRLKLWLR
ncbi:hypothetical protein NHX12_026469 [Muraenolepis orangiensis]|uniref:N-alpha-acetyltransferase 30 n=1 Tax=Muraenolepis orangiensis TaxID=630683 RepID=A0A9Q0EIN7_9TELE|nr:hypothetical protein NHX12_026469 [Muraenolepis orangiensis]